MNRYPGNHMDSGIVTLPRQLKTRPGAPQTHLAYITGDEAQMLQGHKPGTPHKGPHDIPNYDSFSWDPNTGAALESGSGSDWSGGTAWSSTGGSGGTGGQTGDASYEEVWAHSGGEQPDTYTPPEQIYGPGQATPGETGYAYTTLTPGQLNAIFSGTNLSPETLAFFGYTPGSLNVPNELLAQLTEGSIVSGNEAVLSNEPNIGTWSDMESNIHPLMGYNTYLDVMSNPFVIPTTGTGTGGGSGGGRRHGWGGWGSSNLNYGNRSGYGKYANWANRPFMEQSFDSPMPQYYASLKNPGQPRNQEMFKNLMANMYNSGIRSLV